MSSALGLRPTGDRAPPAHTRGRISRLMLRSWVALGRARQSGRTTCFAHRIAQLSDCMGPKSGRRCGRGQLPDQGKRYCPALGGPTHTLSQGGLLRLMGPRMSVIRTARSCHLRWVPSLQDRSRGIPTNPYNSQSGSPPSIQEVGLRSPVQGRSCGSGRSAPHTFAPFSARTRANRSPRPLEAPVTMAPQPPIEKTGFDLHANFVVAVVCARVTSTRRGVTQSHRARTPPRRRWRAGRDGTIRPHPFPCRGWRMRRAVSMPRGTCPLHSRTR